MISGSQVTTTCQKNQSNSAYSTQTHIHTHIHTQRDNKYTPIFVQDNKILVTDSESKLRHITETK